MPRLGRSTTGRSDWDHRWILMTFPTPFFYKRTSGPNFLKTDSVRIPHVYSDHFPSRVPLLSPPIPSEPLFLKKSLLYFQFSCLLIP